MESTTTTYKSDNNEDPKQISVSILSEKSQICYKEEGNTIVMASLKAPLNVEEKQRAPIDLVVVVDVSGSMRGSKLELVQSTLEFIIKELNVKDRLSIVSFQSVIRVELQLTNMDEHGKTLASEATKKLNATGGTALCGGLIQGLKVMRSRKDPNEVASVLLLTDGHANAGPTSTSDIIAAMMNPNVKTDVNVSQRQRNQVLFDDDDEPKQKQEEETNIFQQGLPCSVNTFGYGDNHNATMLKDIAESADGVYYFIDNDEKVAESFADCLGGLLSVVAQNILMTFEAQNGVSIKKMLTKYRTTEITPNKAYQVHMGDIQSEEKRDILCNLIVEPLKEPKTNNPIVNIKIEYFNVLTTTSISQTFVTSIERPEVVTAKESTPIAIDIQRNRIITSDAIEEAKSLASKNKLEEGHKVIEKAMAILKASPSANESSVGRLLRDLTDCLSSMTDINSYQRGGHQKMENMWHAHAKQRSTGYEDNLAEKEYETSNRKVMKQKFKK